MSPVPVYSLRPQTGTSMGIGEKLAITLAKAGTNPILFSQTEDKLQATVESVKNAAPDAKVSYFVVDIQSYDSVEEAVEKAVQQCGDIDILVNNVGFLPCSASERTEKTTYIYAGLALGAPSRFNELSINDILQMNQTNVNGTMFMTYTVLNASMMKRGSGTILNVSSVTGLEVPPFPGEAVYHAKKACMEGFSNALRTELVGTDIKVLVIRPDVVDTNFHEQRVGYDEEMHSEFFKGFE